MNITDIRTSNHETNSTDCKTDQEQLGRRCFMMEYDPHYADVIIKRWEDYTGEQAELIEDAC